MLKRRKESDSYLATDSRHHQSPQITMKVCSFQPALRPSSAEEEEKINVIKKDLEIQGIIIQYKRQVLLLNGCKTWKSATLIVKKLKSL